MDSSIRRITVISVVAVLVMMLGVYVQVAYAASSNAFAAKDAAVKVAEIQNNYRSISDVDRESKLIANAEEMDKYLSPEDTSARVPWYQMYGTWVYSGVLQDESGNPCVIWTCRENAADSKSVLYAFATATYVSSSGQGYFTNVKHLTTVKGEIKAMTGAKDESDPASIVDMVDDIREELGTTEKVDEQGMANAAEARRQYRLQQEEDEGSGQYSPTS